MMSNQITKQPEVSPSLEHLERRVLFSGTSPMANPFGTESILPWPESRTSSPPIIVKRHPPRIVEGLSSTIGPMLEGGHSPYVVGLGRVSRVNQTVQPITSVQPTILGSYGVGELSSMFWNLVHQPIHLGTVGEIPYASSSDDDSMTRQMNEIFSRRTHERFEHGVESLFSRNFTFLIEQYGARAVAEAEGIIFNPLTPPKLAAEALRWLGLMDDAASHEKRRKVLEAALTNDSEMVKDAAIVGLDSLGDSTAIAAIEAAKRRERSPILRSDMEQLLEQLKGE